MRPARRSTIVVLSLAAVSTMLVAAASPASAQRRSATVRRGAPGAAVTPTAEASITLGAAAYRGRVDANCTRDERAAAGSARAYYHIMYPWFGARPAAGQPQWRFELNVSRPTRPGTFERFMFHFEDGDRQGTIQNIPGSQRMGSGTVRVTPNGAGARFDVEGRSQNGDVIRATIECTSFPASEGAGG
ncbi:MAG TPA: hypothetical protein VFS59_04350 [Gemmatimonadaceae bacterium]|nr:hypothetical protein [Gemmatimonadaceae bacterium]